MKKIILILSIFLCLNIYPAASQINEEFIRGNNLYEAGEFKQALEVYLEIEKKIKNWKLYYNIGNSYFKLGDIVRSKIYYLRATELKPFDNSLKLNLKIVDEVLNNDVQLPAPDFISRTIRRAESLLSIDLISVSIVFVFFIFNYFLFRLVRNGRNRKYIYGIIFSFFILLFLFSYQLHRIHNFSNSKLAVIVRKDSKLRSGPGEGNTILFDAGPGVTLRIIEKNRDWVQVSASSEIAGWIKSENIESI